LKISSSSLILRISKNEIEKLAKIGEILRQNTNKDISITGHTARAGTATGRKKLSLERARTVAEYFLSIGAKEEKQIRIQGKGADEPVGDNATAEGRKKNRRVEIIILDN
jgi:outer membrane protein OmpA-like peptidoglycan-associated protein